MNKQDKVLLRMRMSMHDAHYAGELVDGARILQFFGDAATELLIRNDGDEGLFKAYDDVEFTAPVYAGDYLEITGWIEKIGRTSRKMSFEAYKVITNAGIKEQDSACEVLEEPVLVCSASGTCVVPIDKQRKRSGKNG